MNPSLLLVLAACAGLAFLALALVKVRAAAAQVSPGPLATPHADLDTPALCFKCHARGGGMTQRCLDCHTEIAAMRRQVRGYHGRTVADRECASCHPDHAGRDFAMVQWPGGKAETFDHHEAGWALEGKHAEIECRTCHTARLHSDPVARLVPAHGRSKSWLGLRTACQSCHQDPHRGELGANCMKCHGARDWKLTDAKAFDHERTRYPLRGKHVNVACAQCHDPVTAWGKKPAFDRCGACHADAHAGQATIAGRAADCVACHTVQGYRPSTFTVAAHAKTPYPLEGRHAKVECASCHPRRPPATVTSLGTARTLMRPVHERCASCHGQDHGALLAKRADRGACESCHTVTGFRPSALGVAAHAKTRFPLDGAHVTAECRACHAADRKGLPAIATEPLGKARFAFTLAERECAQCHGDAHHGEFASAPQRCATCHGTRTFRPSAVDVERHRAYRFPLDGAHRAVPCSGCHKPLALRPRESTLLLTAHTAPVLSFKSKDLACAACHQNPHGTQFAKRSDQGACEACHGLERFRPADQFDHDHDAAFKLQGAHERVACASCHPAERVGKVVRVKYRGIPMRCEDCHDRGKAGGKMGDAAPHDVPRPLTTREFARARA